VCNYLTMIEDKMYTYCLVPMPKGTKELI